MTTPVQTTTVPIDSISFSFYTGSHYADDPRSMSPKWHKDPFKCVDEVFADILAAKARKVISHRNAGTLKHNVGNSWEVEDHTHLTGRGSHALQHLGSRCLDHRVAFAVSCGLNAPDGLPLDMAIASHRASLVRRCKWLNSIGATELWGDTFGDIRHGEANPGAGVELAAKICAEHGVTMVPEWTTALPTGVTVPCYHRIRRTATNNPKLIEPSYGREIHATFGWNGGGHESPDELAAYEAKGIRLCAYNFDARKYAAANPVTETEV